MEKYIEILYKRQKKIIEEKKREESRIYCGREKEIEIVEKKLLLPKSKSKPVLNIYGPHSIGKSRLLKQFHDSQESKFRAKYVSYIDFFLNYRLRNKRVSFLFKIINDWDPAHSLFTRFRSNSIHLKNIISDHGEAFKKICAKEDLIRKSESITSNRIISLNLLEELIHHNLEAEEVDFILHYSDKQEEVFFSEVENIYHHERMSRYGNIIILDDLDMCDTSIISLVKKMVKRLGDKVFFLVATREPFKWDRNGTDDSSSYIENLPLEKLKPDDITNYIIKKEIYDKDIQDIVIDVSSGFPFLMEAIVDSIELIKKYNLTMSHHELINFFMPSDDFELTDEKEITEFILEKINEIFTYHDRRLKDVIYRLGIPRYFNEEVLFLISEYDDEKIANFFVDLAGLVFTYPGYKESGDWKYHDLVRKICLEFCEKDTERELEIHGKLYQYFKNIDPLESIYHLYKLKPLESMGKAIEIFNDSVQILKVQKASDVLHDFFSYFKEIPEDTEKEEKGLIYTSLANMFINLPGSDRLDNIEKTIIAYNTALQIYDKEKNSVSYGINLKRLGEAYSEMYETRSESAKNEKDLLNAIDYYQNALKIFKCDLFPKDYADINRKIGLILTKFREWKVENFKEAISHLHKAMEIYNDKNQKLNYANTKYDLGNVYFKFANKEDSISNLQKSLKLYEEALIIYKEENQSFKYGEVWEKIGIVHYKIDTDKSKHLSLAINAFNEALKVFSKDKFPIHFVEIKKYQGLAFYYLRTGDTEANIEKALSCFQDAIEIVDFKKHPEDYAKLNIYLGNVYARLRLGDRIQNLERSLSLYSRALEIFNRNKSPHEYAEILNNKGMIYLELSTGSHKENIKKAIELFRKALDIRTKDLNLEDYASTKMNLGSAYQELISDGENNLKEAVLAYNEALSVYNPEKYPLDFAMITNNLGNIYEILASKFFKANDFPQFRKYICSSLNNYSAALKAIDKNTHPQFFEIITKNEDKLKKIVVKLGISC
ncbi:ATP-binding protein [Candidatus Poribacteria bacterium]|nr:ATP-binding protein [Candidatus Poribacteria bacterium]